VNSEGVDRGPRDPCVGARKATQRKATQTLRPSRRSLVPEQAPLHGR
jgi:hypothetical protein